MLQKLACLAVFAGGLQSGLVHAQFVPVINDAGVGKVAGVEFAVPDVPTIQSLSLSHATGAGDEPFGLSDSERFQLRQQIRDAAQDIYVVPSKAAPRRERTVAPAR